MPYPMARASPVRQARVAGLLGVITLASGSFAAAVASRLIVPDDLAATSRNVIASESLLRLGITANLVMMIAWMLYALMLYRILSAVNKHHAMVMLALVLSSVPIYMLNQVNLFAVLLAAEDQRPDQLKCFLDLYKFGNLIAVIFFGLWLLPLGLLVFKSGFLPKVLGILLMIGSLGYLVLFVRTFLFPGSQSSLWTNPLLVVTHVSELALMFWLLIRGVNVALWERLATEAST